MPIVDARSLLTDQTLHCLDDGTPTSDGDFLGTDPHIDFRSDQATGDGVGIGTNVDGAALTDTDAFEDVVGVQSRVGQGAKGLLLFAETFGSSRVSTIDDLPDECHVVVSADKVATSAEQ